MTVLDVTSGGDGVGSWDIQQYLEDAPDAVQLRCVI
jgi:hypothetical protein